MHAWVGMPSPMVMTARHLVKCAPASRYSSSLSARPSRPWVYFSFGRSGMLTVLLSTLRPGITPWSSSTFGNGLPSEAFWPMVSSKRITPDRYSPMPSVVNSISRYARRESSVDSMPTASKRFPMVPMLSSAASMPLPGGTNSIAVLSNTSAFTRHSFPRATPNNKGPGARRPGASILYVVVARALLGLDQIPFSLLRGSGLLRLLDLARLPLLAGLLARLAGLLLRPVVPARVAHYRD